MFPFYLKDPKADKKTPIRMRVYIGNRPHHYSTGETVHPAEWDFVKQRCRAIRSLPFAYATNARLERVQSEAARVMALFKTQGIVPDWPTFKREMDRARGIEVQDTVRVLQEFEARTKGIEWQTFSADWGEKFTQWLIHKKGYAINTTGRVIKTLKTFLNAAVLDGHSPHPQFKRMKVLTERTDEVYLTPDEIQVIWQMEGLRPALQVCRDIFVFACFTGLRYVDYASVVPANIRGRRLSIYQQKTGHPVVIPLREECMTILERYGDRLPPIPENQVLNKQIKEICRLAGIAKAEKVTTHTARRSFATNLYLSGFPATDIMRITGHRTEKSFLLYIRHSPTDTADRLAEFWGM